MLIGAGPTGSVFRLQEAVPLGATEKPSSLAITAARTTEEAPGGPRVAQVIVTPGGTRRSVCIGEKR